MDAPPVSSCRLYAILARDGRSAVVFRRGPSRFVLTLRWWLDSDTLEQGQWLKGRIYERRGDLSPDGELLVYMGAKWNTALETWTAVSRAPYLTALALWKGFGAWGGGGVFDGPRRLGLNLRAIDYIAPKGLRVPWHPLDREEVRGVPKDFSVSRIDEWAGRGEDNPICYHRIYRDGWRCIAEGQAGRYGENKNYAWVLHDPEVLERVCPVAETGASAPVLRRELKAVGQRDGPWYVEDFIVQRQDGTVLRTLADCSWADWQANGDLLFALQGRLYRLPRLLTGEDTRDPLTNTKLVADLTALTFKPLPAPDWAQNWPA